MTWTDLLVAGYKSYPPNPQLDHFDKAYYKMFRSPQGDKLYQIGIRFWEHSKYGPNCPDGWDALVQFYTPTDLTFDVLLHIHSGVDLGDVESFYARVYESMGCRPYEEAE